MQSALTRLGLGGGGILDQNGISWNHKPGSTASMGGSKKEKKKNMAIDSIRMSNFFT